VVPAGAQGTITLDFESNRAYRIGLIAGLALLPLLLLLALVPARRPVAPEHPTRTRSPGKSAAIGLLAAAGVIAGVGGIAVFGAALIATYLLRHRQPMLDQLTVAVTAGALILAGSLLSRYPWRSVDGYIGHSPWVQALALISLAAMATSTLPRPAPRTATETDIATEPSS
jgi:arabinofuranan 3-O-arabinosyltransferase